MTTIVTRATKGSALSWTEGDANITNLNNDKIEAVVDDTTPQLGGNLDVNGNSIVSASNGNISITPNGTGNIVLDGQNWPQAAPATNGEYLTATAAGQTSWTDRVNAKTIYETVKNVTGSSIAKGTPVYQVGISGNTITVGLARADDVAKLAIGVLDEAIADQAEGRMIVLGEIKGVDTSTFTTGDKVYLGATGGYTNVAPTSSTVARQFLGIVNRIDANNGSGYITGTLTEDSVKWTGSAFELWDGDSWVALSTGISNVSEDTSPTLGGDLDVGGHSIVSTSNGNIAIVPNGTGNIQLTPSTGKIVLGALDFPTSMGSNGQVLTTNGSSAMSWTTVSGGVTLTDDTSTNATRYLVFDDSTSGTQTGLNVSSTKLTFNPSTGILTATGFSGPINGTVGATTAAAGTFTTLTANTSASLKAITEGALYDLGTTGGTITPNVANGNVQKITLNSALTINGFTSAVAGQTLTLIIYGGTSYTSITSTMKFAGGVKTLTATAGCIDILSVYYDGTNYFASLGKGFA